VKETKKVTTTIETSGNVYMTGRELVDILRKAGVQLPPEGEVRFDISANHPSGPAWHASHTHISLDLGTIIIGWTKREQKTEE